uniref:Uncharacterized protein n=1 Tax=Anopheles quadriannulatus TaxID=34691 RepID=A0A182XT48_ANOQN
MKTFMLFSMKHETLAHKRTHSSAFVCSPRARTQWDDGSESYAHM